MMTGGCARVQTREKYVVDKKTDLFNGKSRHRTELGRSLVGMGQSKLDIVNHNPRGIASMRFQRKYEVVVHVLYILDDVFSILNYDKTYEKHVYPYLPDDL